MWSAPYSFDFHSNWMGFAITKEGCTSSSNEWFDKMYGERKINENKINEFSTCLIKKYNTPSVAKVIHK